MTSSNRLAALANFFDASSNIGRAAAAATRSRSPAAGSLIARLNETRACNDVARARAIEASTARECDGFAARNASNSRRARPTSNSRFASSDSPVATSSRVIAASSGNTFFTSSGSGFPSKARRYSRARSARSFSRKPRTKSSGFVGRDVSTVGCSCSAGAGGGAGFGSGCFLGSAGLTGFLSSPFLGV